MPLRVKVTREVVEFSHAWGVPIEEIQLGIKNGARKVNVCAHNRLVTNGAVQKVLSEAPDKFDPRHYQPLPLEEMARRCKS